MSRDKLREGGVEKLGKVQVRVVQGEEGHGNPCFSRQGSDCKGKIAEHFVIRVRILPLVLGAGAARGARIVAGLQEVLGWEEEWGVVARDPRGHVIMGDVIM